MVSDYITQTKFNELLNFLKLLHSEILYPLNRSDLIYKGSEVFDPFEYKLMAGEDPVRS